jgi:hypothetical protein
VELAGTCTASAPTSRCAKPPADDQGARLVRRTDALMDFSASRFLRPQWVICHFVPCFTARSYFFIRRLGVSRRSIYVHPRTGNQIDTNPGNSPRWPPSVPNCIQHIVRAAVWVPLTSRSAGCRRRSRQLAGAFVIRIAFVPLASVFSCYRCSAHSGR